MRLALEKYCYEVIEMLPLKWKEEAIQQMVTQKQDKPTERIKELINFVIDQTEQELHSR